MNSPEQIERMTSPEAQDHAERLAVQLCGTDRFKTDLAERLGYTRPAVNGWFAEGGRPPTVVVLYLEAELRRMKAERALTGLKRALDTISTYT